MQIPLNQFEQYIDETILQRGLNYFKKGKVQEPLETGYGELEAVVEGSEDYIVNLTIRNEIVTEFSCNCPYDMGPVCKHVAAVIFYLQKEELGLDKKTKSKKTNSTPISKKQKTPAEQVNDLLEKATHDELKEFIREHTSKNSSLRSLFLSYFIQYNSNDTKELYVKTLKTAIRSVSDRHGFIDWSASRRLAIEVTTLLESAQKQISNQNYTSAIHICTAIMEELNRALGYADDSNGDLSSCIDIAFESLVLIANERHNEAIIKQVIDYCLSACNSDIYRESNWNLGLLSLAAALQKTTEEFNRIFALIEEFDSEYEQEHAKTIKYDLLVKVKGEAEADKYLEQHLDNYDLRSKAIQKAIDRMDYNKAIQLAHDGINQDKNKRHGYVADWYNWLIKIAQEQNDVNKVIEYARLLFLSDGTSKEELYQILKQNVAPEKWSTFVESLAKEVLQKHKGYFSETLAGIYIKENWWERLLNLLQKHPYLRFVEYYEKYLVKDYSNQLAELYAKGIIDLLDNNIGRSHYKTACKYLRRMIKMGERNKANEVIELFRKKYSNRPALLEELSKV
ncbi:MAG: hypothetical protein JW783_02430 [Bacteroidales bacterium]|nr:hypothetical protein [Bacteroidales bacterium]MBN2749816.1 hypothetical protein [Bacteroidales bacterium]